MKILWITNILFPEAIRLLTGKGEHRTSGGWMLGAADALLKYSDEIQLTVAAPSQIVNSLTFIKGERIDYYALPSIPQKYEYYWDEVKGKVNPDLVHIHGTECPHGLAYVKACGAEHVVVSIQGLVSVISQHYFDGMSRWDIIKNITIHDIFRGTIFGDKRKFKNRGECEKELLRSVNNVIGRTNWDRAHLWSINHNAKYHFCNAILRDEFYTGKWVFSKCVPHSIFLSQAGYPVKGLHQLLKALAIVIEYFPDTHVRIAGNNIIDKSSLFKRLKRIGYGRYILRLIRSLNLKNSITFVGDLNSTEMKNEYLKANLFISPSSIENECNSLGEAQILGTPCIASYVGGMMDSIPNEECGILYRFEDTEMLAYFICKIFKESSSFDNTKMRTEAERRHDPQQNAKTLIKIYSEIAE